MKKIGFALILLTVIFMFVSSASAFTMVKTDTDTITTAQRDTAIARGLRWLANQQKSDGHFEDPANPGYNPVALTAFAVLKFEDHAARLGKNPFDTTYKYHQKVDSGWIYLSTKLLTHTPMNDQNGNDPEQYTDNDNFGIYFSAPEPLYDIGIVMMALQASASPGRPFPNAPGCAATFRDVLEDCVDWCAWAQCDGGSGRGGWRYQPYDNASGYSDNSVSPWPVLGFMSAAAWGIKAPDFVKTELKDHWLDYSQADSSGCFGYADSLYYNYTSGGPFAVTAGGLIELTYCGVPTSDTRWSAASQCICDHWNDGYYCNIGNLYAMYALMKAAMTVYPPVWAFGDTCPEWQPVYDSVLVAVQDSIYSATGEGFWPANWALPWAVSNKVLSTEMALLILQKVAPPPPSPTGNVIIPNTDTCVNPGDYVTLPILLQNNPVPFGGFELEVEFDYTAMTFVGAEMGKLLTDLDSLDPGPPPKHYSWEYFKYRMLPCPACPCCKYKILLLGMNDIPNGPNNVGVPIPAGSNGELVLLHFVVNNDENLRGFKIPVCWEWEGTVVNDTLVDDWDCNENTFSSWTGDTLFVSRLLCQYKSGLCDAPSGRIEPVLVFQNGICGQNCGGVDVCPSGPGFCKRGDINYNTLAYEVADAVLFARYFAEGLNVFSSDPEARAYQICATDVNADGRTLTLSDLVYLIRVILHDAVPIPKLAPSSEIANVTVSNNIITTECASPIGAILFEFDGGVVPTMLAKDMEMIAKDNRILVWSRDGHSIEATSAVVKFIGEANLVNVTAVDRDSRELKTSINAKVAPIAFALNPAYPNPFNPNTNLSFTLPEALSYNLKIYNVVGQLVRSYEGIGKVGLNVITWDSRDNTGDEVASGIYFYKLTAGSFSATQKMVVMK